MRPRRKLDETTANLVLMPCFEGVALVAKGLEVVETVGSTVAFSDHMVYIGGRCSAAHA